MSLLAPRTQLGSYRILDTLGRGGMGVVYLAEHVVLARRVALKVLRPELSHDERSIGRFINEARAVNRIGHANIVEVTDFGSSPDGERFYVMEYLDGQTLRQCLQRDGWWPLGRALHVARQIADALAASHSHGIIHRDLKADNVVLITRGEDPCYVKLLDFGVAKLLIEEPGQGLPMTRPGAVLGTPHYMSPEQALGMPDVDHRTDVYALGVLLYQMLTGRLPFEATAPAAVAEMQIKRPFPDPRERRPSLPAAAADLILQAVAKDRERRFSTMEAVRGALRSVARDLPDDPAAEAMDRPPGTSTPMSTGGASTSGVRTGVFGDGSASLSPSYSDSLTELSAGPTSASRTDLPRAVPLLPSFPSSVSVSVSLSDSVSGSVSGTSGEEGPDGSDMSMTEEQVALPSEPMPLMAVQPRHPPEPRSSTVEMQAQIGARPASSGLRLLAIVSIGLLLAFLAWRALT